MMLRYLMERLRSADPIAQARRKLKKIPLSREDVAIDCGANIGNMTEILGRSGTTVYAFEPNPFAFKILQERFAGRSHIHCIQQGVLDRRDTVKLYLHELSDQDEVHWSTGSSLLDCKNNVRKDKYVEVMTVDLAEFIESLHVRVKILKLDVEGVEIVILHHLLQRGILEKIEYVFVETHEKQIPALEIETKKMRAMLQQHGMTHVKLDWV